MLGVLVIVALQTMCGQHEMCGDGTNPSVPAQSPELILATAGACPLPLPLCPSPLPLIQRASHSAHVHHRSLLAFSVALSACTATLLVAIVPLGYIGVNAGSQLLLAFHALCSVSEPPPARSE